MNGSIRPLVMSRPCASPNAAPSASANSAPITTTSTGEAISGASAFIARMTLPAISAAIEPTERSMPPPMMTKHMPTEMMPMKAVRVRTFIALSQVAKPALSSVPAMHSATRPIAGPSVCARCRQWPARAARRAAAACGVAGPVGGGERRFSGCRWHGRSAPLR